MGRGRKTEAWKDDYIFNNAHAMTARELARALSLSESYVYVFCQKNSLSLKPGGLCSSLQVAQPVISAKSKVDAQAAHNGIEPDHKPKKVFKRPPAVYSNCSPFGIATEIHQNKAI